MIHQAIFDTSKIISAHGIEAVVLSPGSRNAPLTISFARNQDLKIYNIVDERSAGFIALGIAQKTNKPVVLCCTSGTALLNYAPAIAEAYYQQIPLIVLSADRPSEWQDQRDGQTIRQVGAISNFVVGEYQMPTPTNEETGWEYTRKLNEAIGTSQGQKKGPVHINVPFREPFYPSKDQSLEFSNDLHFIKKILGESKIDILRYQTSFAEARKILIVVGQKAMDAGFDDCLEKLKSKAIVLADIISNVKNADIRLHDHFLAGLNESDMDELRPDLLITLGKSVISKSLKQYLRTHKAATHWHIEEKDQLADTFQSVTEHIIFPPELWIKDLTTNKKLISTSENNEYRSVWETLESKTRSSFNSVKESWEFSEYVAFDYLLNALPAGIDLHLANSMPVRYANLLGNALPNIEVFCNRGTSGIDGTNGTAVGNALSSNKTTFLLTGDLSFFYDRNAFFHDYDLSNLKIVIFNNQGGGIFRLINGPSSLPELPKHFETQHQRTARLTAEEFGFSYQMVDDESELPEVINRISQSGKPEILEIMTNPETNERVYKQTKVKMNELLSRG
ncbi:MAG: 2-succinyl-5-enolpyruvyl-6-hydroxy-3-cyclohexene-1-carboxylic-acid synthase [Cyclobacteriaceae bacterium]